jgi:hypothetical protein
MSRLPAAPPTIQWRRRVLRDGHLQLPGPVLEGGQCVLVRHARDPLQQLGVVVEGGVHLRGGHGLLGQGHSGGACGAGACGAAVMRGCQFCCMLGTRSMQC